MRLDYVLFLFHTHSWDSYVSLGDKYMGADVPDVFFTPSVVWEVMRVILIHTSLLF